MKNEPEKGRYSVSFLSFERYYCIGIVLALAFSVFMLVTHGTTSGILMQEGTWFVLGGFSLWYPTSLLILPFIIILILYTVFTIRRITIINENNLIVVKEKAFYTKKKECNIKENEITSIKLIEGEVGQRIIWVIVFSLHMIYILSDGLHLITNPHAFGLIYAQAATYIVSGMIDLAIILLIVIPGTNHLLIHTENEVFSLKYSTWKKDKSISGMVKSVLKLEQTQSDAQKNDNIEQIVPEYPNKRLLSKRLVLAIAFIIIALFSRIFNIFAGGPLRVSLFLLGLILVINATKYEPITLSNAKQNIIQAKNEDFSIYILLKNFTSKISQYIRCEESNLEKNSEYTINLNKIKSLEIIFVCSTSLLLGWTLAAWFRFRPTSFSITGYSVLNIIMGIITLCLLIFVVFNPQMGYSIKTKYENERIEMYQANMQIKHQEINDSIKSTEKEEEEEEEGTKKNNISKWFEDYKDLITHFMRPLALRKTIILVFLIIGIIMALVI